PCRAVAATRAHPAPGTPAGVGASLRDAAARGRGQGLCHPGPAGPREPGAHLPDRQPGAVGPRHPGRDSLPGLLCAGPRRAAFAAGAADRCGAGLEPAEAAMAETAPWGKPGLKTSGLLTGGSEVRT